MQKNTRTLTTRDFEFAKCVAAKDWLGALGLVSQFTVSATGSALGVARWLEAWVRVTASARQVHVAAALIKESLPLLDDATELQAQALPVGFYLADLSHDAELHRDITGRAKRLLIDTTPAVKPWHGRLLYRLGCYWKGAGKNPAKAEAALRESVDWHHRNIGPFDEQDRRCHMRLSLVALAEVHLAQGQRNEAGARAREAQRFLDDGAPGYALLHLQALVAEANHGDAHAIAAHEQGIADAREVSDWGAVVESAAAYGRIMRRLGEWDKLRDVLRPLVKGLIEVGLPAEAHRLQMLAVPSGVDVGAPQDNPTSDMLRLIAELVDTSGTNI